MASPQFGDFSATLIAVDRLVLIQEVGSAFILRFKRAHEALTARSDMGRKPGEHGGDAAHEGGEITVIAAATTQRGATFGDHEARSF